MQVADTSLDNLTASVSPAVRVIETFKPVKIFTTPSGARVIDFGQNISGRERVRLRGQRGDTVRIYHSEILEKGEFFTRNLRKGQSVEYLYPFGRGRGVARAPVRLLRLPPHQGGGNRRRAEPPRISSPRRSVRRRPRTARSFRPTRSSTGCSRISSGGCSDNFVDIPTDCPQRDERLGWTGDAQVFFRTATFNRDVQTFFNKWMADVAAEQYADGAVNGVYP